MSGFDDHKDDLGKVLSVDKDKVRVELMRGQGCTSCTMRGFCFKKDEPAIFEVRCALPLKEGDIVQLLINPGARVGSALLIFGLPLALLFVSFMVAHRYFSELVSVGIAFAVMALSFLLIGLIDRKYGKRIVVNIEELDDNKTE